MTPVDVGAVSSSQLRDLPCRVIVLKLKIEEMFLFIALAYSFQTIIPECDGTFFGGRGNE